MDAQRQPLSVEDVENIEDVPGAADEAEHLGDVHGVAGPGVGREFDGLRPLEGVEAAGSSAALLEDDRILDAGPGQDEVLPGGRLPVGRDPLVDQVRHRGAPSVRRIGPYPPSNPASDHHRI
ncbi:hypothetical protein GCM10027187_58880 [Streptosporangium sandarakinum]